MLGTERHQEIKERFAAVSNAISSLVQDINAIKKVTEDQAASLERLKVTITQIAEVQANQERQLNEILQMVKDIHSSQTAESAQRQKCEVLSEGEDFCSQLSEDGISVSEYLSVRKLHVHESPNGKHFCKRCPLGLTYFCTPLQVSLASARAQRHPQKRRYPSHTPAAAAQGT
jgi:seryl-tRNA synthetase